MGILGLARLIADIAPEAIKEVELKTYFGRRIAIDASMSLYQFLIAIRHSNNLMTNEAGETTSHLVGFFYRTCKLLESGVKPVYVFDGKPPVLKGDTLAKRKEARDDAMKKLAEAKEQGPEEDVQKYTKRLVRVTRQHNDDVKTLLRLMGLPVIESPSEAEAQCAQLCQEGLVYAVATEDMDALTFGAPRVIRNFSSGTGDKVKEVDLSKTLKGLGLDQKQFIDLCILMGCDYCGSIKGIGGKKGLDFIHKYNTIENILTEKYGITQFVDNVEVIYQAREEKYKALEEAQAVKEEKETNGSTNGKFEEAKAKIKEAVDEEVKKWSEDNKDIKEEEDPEDVPFEQAEEDSFDQEILDEDEEDSKEVVSEEETPKKKSKSSKSKKEKESKDVKAAVPDNWLFKGARKLFIEPNVAVGQFKESDLKIGEVHEEHLLAFLVEKHGFSQERVLAALKRIKAGKQKSNQSRIDSFFKPVQKETTSKSVPSKSESASKRSSSSAAAGGKRGRKGK